ncbi:MAG: hydroxymethylbilane synthase [Candidatus Zixiibacteriota bacterium]
MKIGTRGSDLALWQARHVQGLIRDAAGLDAEIVVIRTAGDRDHQTAFAAMPGKGFFTKEIEEALRAGTVDIAVHSLKDLQTVMPDGLVLGAIPERADRRDVLLTAPSAVDRSRPLRLHEGARVGTSSARRIAQLRFLRPDLAVENLRGNVPTRLRKLRDGRYDAILVAAAGLDRLGLDLEGLVAFRLPEVLFVPAPGQGALAVQIRDLDARAHAIVGRLDRLPLRRTVWAEREVLRRLEGGCQLALGAFSETTGNGLRLGAFLGTDEPAKPCRIIITGGDDESVVAAVVSYLKCQTQAGAAVGAVREPPEDRAATGVQSPVRVWITRDARRAEPFRRRLNSSAFDIAAIPVFVAVEAGDREVKRRTMLELGSYDWIFFTSQITVDEMAHLMHEHGARFGAQTRLAAVGVKTKAAIERHGWRVDFTADVADAEAMGEQFLHDVGTRIGRVLFPCGQAAAADLEMTLAEGCTGFDRLVCYDIAESPALAQTLPALPDPHAVVFTSPQAARILLARRSLPLTTTAVSIGPATTEALRQAGFPIVYEPFERSLEGTAEVIHGLFPDPSSPSTPS